MKTLLCAFIVLLLLPISMVQATPPCGDFSPGFDGQYPFGNHDLPNGSVVEVPNKIVYVPVSYESEAIFEDDVVTWVVERSPSIFPYWQYPPWAVVVVGEGLKHGSLISNPSDNVVLKVNENYKYKPRPTVIGLEPDLYFERPSRLFGTCYPERTLTLNIKYKDGNVPELGMLAFVYIANTIEDLNKPESLFYLDRTQDGVSFDIAEGTPGLDTLNQPFCVAVELMDIAGQLSPRSAPLCIDPTNKSASYFSGDDSCSSVGVENPAHGESVPYLLLLLVFGVCRKHTALS